MILHRFLTYEIKENLGVAFYTKPKEYKIEISCFVKNKQNIQNDVNVLFPVPPNLRTQVVKKGPIYKPANYELKAELKFKNKYVLWSKRLKPSGKESFKQTFLIGIAPNIFEKNKKYDMEEYHLSELDRRLYLKSEEHVDFKNILIKKLTTASDVLPKDINNIAKILYKEVVKNLEYGQPIEGLYSSKEALESEKTDCGGFSTVLAALLRYSKIPARIVSGFLLSPAGSVMHAWVEFLLPDGNWVPADPTIEKLLKSRGTSRSGKFGYIGSDHLVFSLGSDLEIDLSGKKIKLDILQNPLVMAADENSVEVESSLKATLIL